jgi:hypothetical protein
VPNGRWTLGAHRCYPAKSKVGANTHKGQVDILLRILVAFEDDYPTYRETIAAAIQVLRRPRVEVHSAELRTLGDYIERFDPQLVICTRANTVDPGGRPAWVELSVDPLKAAKVCVGGRYSERTNPTLEVLLSVIDEVEELIRTDEDLRGC